MRLNNLSGFFLLLWPTIWSLWISTHGKPSCKQVIIFVLGCFFTRTSGCIINDIIDHKIDKKINRTKNRPLPQNIIRLKEAFFTFLIFVVLSFSTIFFLNIKAFFLSILVLILICTYPKLKLYSYFPQVFLGITFSCSILIVYAATKNNFPITCWLLFAANIAWTTAYDTQYALLDLNNDIMHNIKSTAVYFKKKSKNFILLLQLLMLLIFIMIGYIEQLGIIFYFSLILSSIVFYMQNIWVSKNIIKYIYNVFLSNNIVGVLIFFGISIGYLK
ncbi:p-hydroxybenzoate octaprenyltransferase [Wigglesworthia glossinidia endosymbiont of Glossina morsitans morsitans (Yale colony)]|uniref:4-hydroxybenzoate octaprenyltransferase n=2 Tax=Wigglesworthia glossinidia TaxID=51229 RepID=H6Q5I5_WIGGL|nr:p-hydroxybenzoate octaprenyltransferase [Wigglesworthia glossinidia endosymbiont of Glossina morsitans morsitans (Yale colony)]